MIGYQFGQYIFYAFDVYLIQLLSWLKMSEDTDQIIQ